MDFLKCDNDEDDNNEEIFCNIDKNEEDIELEEIENDLDDWVDEEEDDQMLFKSLFDDSYFSSVDLLISYDIDVYNFNLKQVVAEYAVDDISIIKLINFIRSKTLSNTNDSITSMFIDDLNNLLSNRSFLEDDLYMKPTLDDDPLLYMYADYLLTIEEDEE